MNMNLELLVLLGILTCGFAMVAAKRMSALIGNFRLQSFFLCLLTVIEAAKGNYVELDGMREVHCTRLTIHLDKPSPAHTDGELFDDWLTDFDYQIFPGVVPVLMK